MQLLSQTILWWKSYRLIPFFFLLMKNTLIILWSWPSALYLSLLQHEGIKIVWLKSYFVGQSVLTSVHVFCRDGCSRWLSCLLLSSSNSCKTHSICKEFIGYTSNDIEIFITAYEITASIVKQTRAYRAHPLLLGQSLFGTKMDKGLMRDMNW